MSAPRTCECMTCPKCRAREWTRNRYRLKAYGQWSPHGDLDTVRAHLAELRASGLGIGAIANASGVSRSQIERLANGRATRTSRDTARKILAVTPDARARIPAWRVARRLQALNAIGYSTRHLATLLGTNQDIISDHLSGKRHWVQRGTLDAVTALYDQLCMTPGGNTASARIAHRRGYAPPLAWDNIDDEHETPAGARGTLTEDVDPVVVQRILRGDWRHPANRAERYAVADAFDGTDADLERLTGWNVARDRKVRREAASEVAA